MRQYDVCKCVCIKEWSKWMSCVRLLLSCIWIGESSKQMFITQPQSKAVYKEQTNERNERTPQCAPTCILWHVVNQLLMMFKNTHLLPSPPLPQIEEERYCVASDFVVFAVVVVTLNKKCKWQCSKVLRFVRVCVCVCVWVLFCFNVLVFHNIREKRPLYVVGQLLIVICCSQTKCMATCVYSQTPPPLVYTYTHSERIHHEFGFVCYLFGPLLSLSLVRQWVAVSFVFITGPVQMKNDQFSGEIKYTLFVCRSMSSLIKIFVFEASIFSSLPSLGFCFLFFCVLLFFCYHKNHLFFLLLL